MELNELAAEIGYLDCLVERGKEERVQLLSHFSGVLAAEALGFMNCHSIKGHRRTAILSQCEPSSTPSEERTKSAELSQCSGIGPSPVTDGHSFLSRTATGDSPSSTLMGSCTNGETEAGCLLSRRLSPSQFSYACFPTSQWIAPNGICHFYGLMNQLQFFSCLGS